MQDMENKEKSKQKRRISIKLENNIIIHFRPTELITELEISKEGDDELIPFKDRDFNLYEKILKSKVLPNPIIKKNYKIEDIKVNKDYVLAENLEEEQIIPELYEENENEEDFKSLEKSLEKSVEKSFDKSYEKSFDKSYNLSINQSINQSYNQSMTQSYNQSYADGAYESSFQGSKIKSGSSGRGLIHKLNQVFSEGIDEDKNEVDEDEDSKKNEDEIREESKEEEEQEDDIDVEEYQDNEKEDDNEEGKEKSEEEGENEDGEEGEEEGK